MDRQWCARGTYYVINGRIRLGEMRNMIRKGKDVLAFRERYALINISLFFEQMTEYFNNHLD